MNQMDETLSKAVFTIVRAHRSCAILLCLGALVFGLIGAARAADNRFMLASQDDWNAKRGFYIDFENSTEGDAPCGLADMKLAMGVADGANWRFIIVSRPWQYGRTYHLRAEIGPQNARLWLDGSLIQQTAGGFMPDKSDLDAAWEPGWAEAPAEYQIAPESLSVTGGEKRAHFEFPPQTRQTIALSLFAAPPGPTVSAWRAGSGGTITIEATFQIIPKPRWQDFAPMVDRYGQCIYADWPGKVTSDDQIRAALSDENRRLAAWGTPTIFDRYGGLLRAGWKEKATGYYTVAKHAGKWWLVTPLGNPCFYNGLCTAPNVAGDVTPVTGREALFAWLPAKTGPYAQAWTGPWGGIGGQDYFAFPGATEMRLFGAGWKTHEETLAARRIRVWGFSGVAKWGDVPGLPSIPVLEHNDVPNIARHPDIFDPAVQAAFRDSLARQIAPRVNDPNVVGWSLGNEYDEIITPDEITAILGKGASTPAKRALVDYALQTIYGRDIGRMAGAWQVTASTSADLDAAAPTPPAGDIETLRRFYADRYYDFIYKTVKAIDPNHLYFGFWIVPGWWVNESDWQLIAPHCDVIGYDHYAPEFADDHLIGLMQQTDKPVLCGEFSFPPDYAGKRAFAQYGSASAKTEQEAGQDYIRWEKDAAANPYCVGTCWFEYRDEPITGRGPDRGTDLVIGEDYAFGLIDATGRPKWPLVTAIRQANLAAAKWRLGTWANR